jgi:tRNA (guanine-N7-)-methyltransferase
MDVQFDKILTRGFSPEKVPEPRDSGPIVDWASLQPTDLEIGCGVGLHPIRYGQAHPDRRLIAIEHTSEKFGKFARRLLSHPEITNVIPVHADAISWVTHRVPENVLDRVFLLYPNPYPMARDLNKRWHAMPFMEFLLKRLKVGSTLVLASNELFYADEAEQFFSARSNVENVTRRALTLADTPIQLARTHFERKYLERGETCHELVVKVQ